MVVFPVSLFLGESDLTPLSERIDEFVSGLTKWEPEVKEKGIISPPRVIAPAGKDYAEALANMNDLFLWNQWGDGLPLQPATEEHVDWILTGTDLPRDKEITRIGPRAGIATPEQLAVCLAMAGGRPEYLPVLIAIAEGLGDPEFGTPSWQTTSRTNFVVTIVNGPITKQIRLSHTFGLMGPDPQRPAGVRIGRALRLLLQDVGGATPGAGTMSIYGFGRSTNCVFAEDEDNIPVGFGEPLNTEPRYGGYPKGTNSVLLNISCIAENLRRRADYIGETLEEEMRDSLQVCADHMRVASLARDQPPADESVLNRCLTKAGPRSQYGRDCGSLLTSPRMIGWRTRVRRGSTYLRAKTWMTCQIRCRCMPSLRTLYSQLLEAGILPIAFGWERIQGG
jgi:hypothetical protein